MLFPVVGTCIMSLSYPGECGLFCPYAVWPSNRGLVTRRATRGSNHGSTAMAAAGGRGMKDSRVFEVLYQK